MVILILRIHEIDEQERELRPNRIIKTVGIVEPKPTGVRRSTRLNKSK